MSDENVTIDTAVDTVTTAAESATDSATETVTTALEDATTTATTAAAESVTTVIDSVVDVTEDGISKLSSLIEAKANEITTTKDLFVKIRNTVEIGVLSGLLLKGAKAIKKL